MSYKADKRCDYIVVISIHDLPMQSVEDMELNAEQYIKDDIDSGHLYIEDIQLIEEWGEPGE